MKKVKKAFELGRSPLRHELHPEDPRRAAIDLDALIIERIEYLPPTDKRLGVDRIKGSYLIHARFDAFIKECFWCHEETGARRTRQRLRVRDIPLHGLPTEILIIAQTYKCTHCGGKMGLRQLGIDDRRQMTTRLRYYIEDRVFRRAVEDLVYDTGVSKSTIASIADVLSDEIEKLWLIRTPRILGIDDIYIGRIARTVFVDSETGEVLALARSKHEKDVVPLLRQFSAGGQVEYVTLDMDQAYQPMIRRIMPEATIVFDKFHIVQRVNEVMKNIRIEWQKSGGMGRNKLKVPEKRSYIYRRHRPMRRKADLMGNLVMPDIPFLQDVYDRKEDFLSIMDIKSKKGALKAYRAWIFEHDGWLEKISDSYGAVLAALCRDEFSKLTDLIASDEAAFFAGFDGGLSNARVENANGKIRRIERVGRGYSYPVLSDKVLFGQLTPSVDLIECNECFGRESRENDKRMIDVYGSWNDLDSKAIYHHNHCLQCVKALEIRMTDGIVNKPVRSAVRDRPRSRKRMNDRVLHAKEDAHRKKVARRRKSSKKVIDDPRQDVLNV